MSHIFSSDWPQLHQPTDICKYITAFVMFHFPLTWDLKKKKKKKGMNGWTSFRRPWICFFESKRMKYYVIFMSIHWFTFIHSFKHLMVVSPPPNNFFFFFIFFIINEVGPTWERRLVAGGRGSAVAAWEAACLSVGASTEGSVATTPSADPL